MFQGSCMKGVCIAMQLYQVGCYQVVGSDALHVGLSCEQKRMI